MNAAEEKSLNFIEEIVEKWLEEHPGKTILTRFPPEPNGYLHIGHAKAICLNFGLAKKYGGSTNLRFDDTNPVKEDVEYVDSIREDVQWLGFDWKEELYASDYFEVLYGFAKKLIEQGKAYVDFSSAEEIARQKGSPTEPGINSPYRNQTIADNLNLFEKMRSGEFPDGHCTLRAKIDMAHVNMHMRDPLMYRIKHVHHHRTGDKWCIYPMYDFAHGQSDSIEEITHSICTLEFIPHRELYDWYIENLGIYPSKQYEFARLNLNYTVMSKRYLLQLVNDKIVSGWDDPRMPTISGLRRRGYTPASLREFCDRIGVAKRENVIDVSLLEFCIRQDLENSAHRVMGVMDPIKLVITNYQSNAAEVLHCENIPGIEAAGKHEIEFGKELWIEREDFMIDPPKGYFRLHPDSSHVVRLKYGYIIQYEKHIIDDFGNIVEVHVTYHPNSKSGQDQSGIKVKTALHWVPKNAIPAEVRLYDRLFTEENPTTESKPNAGSLIVNQKALLEPYCAAAEAGKSYQFFRLGYFCLDKDSKPNELVFNKTVGLKDTFTKK
ncbi:MAG: glutamine--tRNA ligase/YqeY domain fusion protein [Saprospiraceae bacterium]